MSAKMRSIFKKSFLKELSIFVTLGVTSCANFVQPELSIQSVSIYTDLDANQNSAVAVDLVLVYDDQLVKTFSSLSASKYFSSSPQLLLDNPSLVSIWHWELVPGQTVQDFQVQQSADAYAGFVFANYLTPGDHRLKVAPNGVIKVLLLKDDLKNLVIYDTRNVTSGTTMSNTPGIPQGECQYGIADAPQPCTPPIPQPCQVDTSQQSNSACCNAGAQGSVTGAQGAAITTQPLSPLKTQQSMRPLNAQQAQGSRAQNGQSASKPYSLQGAVSSISKGTQKAASSINQATENVANTASSLSKTTQSVQKNINTISQTPQNIKNSVSAIGRSQAPKAAGAASKQSPIKPHPNR